MGMWTAGEHPLFVTGPAGLLETVLTWPDALLEPGVVAVVCHPNPAQGGTMNNKVVSTLVRLCRDRGWPVLRFNFRGTGASEGEHDNAVGEIDDLAAVLDWAVRELDAHQVVLAGFSFGSYVAAANVPALPERGLQLKRLILVAPPVGKYSYASVRLPADTLLVQGEADEVVVPGEVYAWAEAQANPPELIRFPGTGHFFHGRLTELRDALAARL